MDAVSFPMMSSPCAITSALLPLNFLFHAGSGLVLLLLPFWCVHACLYPTTFWYTCLMFVLHEFDQFNLLHQGIRKEAEWLIRNLKHNSGGSISTSMKIRQSALKFALEKYGELEPYKNQEISESESESEMSSDSDDDVAGIEDNYMVWCMFWKNMS